MTLIQELEAIVGSAGVIAGAELDRPVSYWNTSPTRAVGLVAPATTEEVSRVLALCSERGQTVVTQGGMTNCVAAADAGEPELILSTHRMNTIGMIDPVQGTVTVEAGVILQQLQEACAQQDLTFPLDLGARGSCTVGGNVSTNAGGINVLRYGMMRQLVLGMEVVLADGRILSSMNEMLKNNTAYDLKQLFIGSEGTLGIVTKVVLRLFPRPVTCQTALVACGSFDAVTSLLDSARTSLGGDLSCFEVMWGDYYAAVTRDRRAPIPAEHPFYVIVESEGFDPGRDPEKFEAMLAAAWESGSVGDAIIAGSERERRDIWMTREEFDPILKPDPCFLYDVSLPIPAMADYVESVRASLDAEWPGTQFYALGHIADGNLHFFVRPAGAGEESHPVVNAKIYEPLATLGGAVSAEHGIGTEKLDWLGQSRSPVEIALMRELKRTLDPGNILNPGRVLPDAA